ncbi:peritrophin-48 [Scaptodrosophila lebanonensis]|uniref:Peritrophin-48 n=1 Tax=Drosophila lebanonensis TaxID=7225 RepID=A0A6J2T7Q9_DROLE|nr:peritrophin-48 [Scaptodrosophila lebanonensis]
MGRGPQVLIIATAALLCCSITPTSALNMSDVCLLVKHDTFVASPSDCHSYYTCVGATAQLYSCPTGYGFSKDSQACVPAQSICGASSASSACQNAVVGTYQAVQNSCNSFWYCSASGPLQGYCPTGDNFNPTTQSCDLASDYSCPWTETDASDASGETINLCSIIPNDVFFGNPTSCSNWLYCDQGTLKNGTCPKGFVFNVATGTCDYAVDTTCSQVTNAAGLIDYAGFNCKTAGDMIAASACNQYYTCSSSKVYVLNTCASGLYFDTVSQKCITRASAQNNCDRCLGSTSQFVNSYGSNCTSYLTCKNGVQFGSVQTCPTGHPFFNENDGLCELTNPQFTFCFNIATVPT